MYEIIPTKRFQKDLQKLLRKDPKILKKISKQIEILSLDPKYKSLRTHRLNSDSWSISIDMSIRVIFSLRGNKIFCTRVGTHKEVY